MVNGGRSVCVRGPPRKRQRLWSNNVSTIVCTPKHSVDAVLRLSWGLLLHLNYNVDTCSRRGPLSCRGQRQQLQLDARLPRAAHQAILIFRQRSHIVSWLQSESAILSMLEHAATNHYESCGGWQMGMIHVFTVASESSEATVRAARSELVGRRGAHTRYCNRQKKPFEGNRISMILDETAQKKNATCNALYSYVYKYVSK